MLPPVLIVLFVMATLCALVATVYACLHDCSLQSAKLHYSQTEQQFLFAEFIHLFCVRLPYTMVKYARVLAHSVTSTTPDCTLYISCI